MADRLKDIFFTSESLNYLGDKISEAYPEFNKIHFLDLVFNETWEDLELKARMRHVSTALHATLPEDYRQAINILKKIAPFISGFDAMVIPDYVEVYGLDDWGCSLPALGFFTKYGSAEFAIRPFLLQDSDRVMPFMLKWAEDEHPYVRRFASEGCRPRLPWAMAIPSLKRDPTPILKVLETLKNDDSEFVRKSVANNLNDISKDHPETALATCERWYGSSKETDWIVKHALRGLLKAGNKRALQLFGFGDPDNLSIQDLKLPSEVRIGSDLLFSFELNNKNKSATKVRVEYAIDYIKATGKKSRKIFQLMESNFDPGKHDYSKKLSFADMSTRKHHPGRHRLTIICNGKQMVYRDFQVER